MNKRVFTMMIALLLAAFVPKAYGQADVWEGNIATEVPNDGTTYTITTGAQLAWVAQQVNSNTLSGSGMTFELANNIDLGNQPWTPIGKSGDVEASFDGTFDGAGFVISRLSITGSAELAGLFGYIGAGGTVNNLGVTGSITSDTKYARAGGIAGLSFGTITNCYTDVTVTATSSKAYAGGIVGFISGATISNCFALGSCTATSTGTNTAAAGGIAGLTSGATIKNCYALGDCTATSTGTATTIAGGIAGDMGGSLSNCYATGTIKGQIAGGIAGKAYAGDEITGCIALNKGGITGSTGNNRIVGINASESSPATITNCYASPLISGTWTDKGADKLNGADLTTDNFITPSAENNAFNGWLEASWDLTTAAANLPTLQGFKATQSVPARADFLKKVTLITNQTQLADIIKDPSGSYVLANDIDLGDQSWTPIGDYSSQFTGTFDGAGYVISGRLSITGTTTYVGLFGYIGAGGTVKNLGVTGTVTGNAGNNATYAGGIAGQSEGTITNCYTNVTVAATGSNAYAGGIVGYMPAAAATATTSNCFALGNCTATGTNIAAAGGIVANKAGGSLSYCYATGTIETKGEANQKYTGGIVGQKAGTLTGCIALNKGGITGSTGNNNTNRIVGNGSSGITNCYASPLIPGTWTEIGADKQSGADLTTDNFITSPSAENGAFKDWPEASWDLTTAAANLPTLKGFKAAQPVPVRADFLKKVTIITTKEELADIKDPSGSYVLANDIDLGKQSWTPIGNYSSPFTGTFDGAGYVISGLKVSITSNAQLAGLFGYIGAGGTVKNLGVTGTVEGTNSGTANIGGIAGESSGTITNCYTDVIVTATGKGGSTANAGGIVGYMSDATTSNCFTLGSCTATSTRSAVAGGIVGYFENVNTLSNCYATGTISGKIAGGIAGQAKRNTQITGCIALNKGGITGSTGNNRILGENESSPATITNCYASPIPGTWTEIGADKENGADLTTENFVTSNKAFGDAWTTSGYWAFDSNKTYLPKLLTTDKKKIDGQIDTERTLYFASPVTIDKEIPYDVTTHGGKNLVVTATGILTVTTEGASISSIDIKEGGQVNTTKPLIITEKLTTARTLANKWITFGSPLVLTPKSAASTYATTGYAKAAAENQVWKTITIASGATLPATPYLLAAENAGTALTLTATGTTDAPVTIPAFKKAETSEAQNNGIFLFRMNPALSNQTMTNIYVLSDDGYRFELHETAYVVKPFECYLIANAATRAAIKSLRAGGDLPTGNTPVLPTDAFRIWGAGGQLHLDATTPADVAIYNLSGQLLHRFRLDGSRTLTLARGIYLVRSNNITYKVSL